MTPQLLSLFSACFGKEIAVLHSGLRVGERYDEYKRIDRGEARVVVGTRSAVFAPLRELGLIVVDEEQEHTYKSENSPRYHAREVALYRGNREKALVVLGSATPSVETMYRAFRNHKFIDEMKVILNTLETAYDYPVDIEYTVNVFHNVIFKST